MPNRTDSILAACTLAVALALAAPAAAQSEPTGFQKFLGAIGLLDIPRDDMPTYRERAPLVVPPSNSLIQPRNPGDVSAYNPDWPVDADQRKRRAVDPKAQQEADELFYSGKAMSPAQLNRGRISAQEAARRDAAVQRPDGSIDGPFDTGRMSPTELGFKGWGAGKKAEERVEFTGEPERRALTDPPPGLRTPSRDAPYGVVSSGSGKPRAVDYQQQREQLSVPR